MWKGFLFSCSMLIEPDLFQEVEKEFLVRELSANRHGCHVNTSPSYEFDSESRCLDNMWIRAIGNSAPSMFSDQVLVQLKSVVCLEK